jgi:hypothetical protein
MQCNVKWELADPAETLRLSSTSIAYSNPIINHHIATSFFHGICIAD